MKWDKDRRGGIKEGGKGIRLKEIEWVGCEEWVGGGNDVSWKDNRGV